MVVSHCSTEGEHSTMLAFLYGKKSNNELDFSSVNSRTTLPGEPRASERGGILIPPAKSVFAPIIHS
jgi:hypothetical protein